MMKKRLTGKDDVDPDEEEGVKTKGGKKSKKKDFVSSVKHDYGIRIDQYLSKSSWDGLIFALFVYRQLLTELDEWAIMSDDAEEDMSDGDDDDGTIIYLRFFLISNEDTEIISQYSRVHLMYQ